MTTPDDRYLGITASARDLGADRHSLVYDGDARTQGRKGTQSGRVIYGVVDAGEKDFLQSMVHAVHARQTPSIPVHPGVPRTSHIIPVHPGSSQGIPTSDHPGPIPSHLRHRPVILAHPETSPLTSGHPGPSRRTFSCSSSPG